MSNKKATKRALLTSIVSLFLCFAMLLGTTFAWFTDSASNTGNRIIAGTLKIDLLMQKKVAETYQYTSIAGGSGDLFREATHAQNDPASLWEPGKTQIVFLAVQNKGSLALKYNIILDISDISGYPSMVHGEPADADYYTALEFALLDGAKAISETQFTYGGNTYTLSTLNWTTVQAATAQKGDVELGRVVAAENGVMDELPNVAPNYETQYFALAVHMKEDAGNEFQGAGINIDVNVVATQYNSEDDIFDNPNYDKDTVLPAVALLINGYSAKTYEPDAVEDTIIEDVAAVSTIPAGTAVTVDGGTTYNTLDSDTTGQLNRIISSTSAEESVTYDISYTFTTTTTVGTETTTETKDVTNFSNRVVNVLNVGKDLKIVKVTHSHGGASVEMNLLSSKDEDANGYWYDYVTGELTIKSDTYSEFEVLFDSKIAVETLTVSPEELTLWVGQDSNLTGAILPETATYQTITWTSSNPESLSVDSTGTITAIKHGTFTVTATADGVTSSPVTVEVWAEAELNGTDYSQLSNAVAAAGNNDTVNVLRNLDKRLTITGVENLTINLNGFTLTAPADTAEEKYAIRVYDCDGVTIRNGTVNGQIRIGEHQKTIIKWKYADQYPLYGYHPLAPAQNILFENVNVNSGSKSAFYFTNIEDDLVRGAPSNYVDNDLYGQYIYKTGYQTQEQSDNNKKDEVFTVCTDKDSVRVVGGTYSSDVALVGNMWDYLHDHPKTGVADHRYTEVLSIEGGTFSNDSLGKFVPEGKYLVGTASNSFAVTDSAPAEYTAKDGNVYYTYAGGANDAILFADFGDTLYLKESADVEKVFTQDDELTIVYEAENIAYTGAITSIAGYIVETKDSDTVEGGKVFYPVLNMVAAVYATSQNGNWKTATKVGEYASLEGALAGLKNDYTIVILKDFTVGDDMTYSYGGVNYKCAMGFATRSTIDFNGHMITYTGTGSCIFSSQQSGYLYLKDTSTDKTGGITATNGGYCFQKRNQKSVYTYISGGNYISPNNRAIYYVQGNGLEISGGYFEGVTANGSGYTIKGGTFNSEPPSGKIASGKTVTDNGDGTYTVG